jgi:hypothetical protein
VISAFRHRDAIGRPAVKEQTHERDAANALDASVRTRRAPAAAQDDEREASPIEIEASAASMNMSRHVGVRREASKPVALIDTDYRRPVVRFHFGPPRG